MDVTRGSGSVTDSTESWESWQKKCESMKTTRTLELQRQTGYTKLESDANCRMSTDRSGAKTRTKTRISSFLIFHFAACTDSFEDMTWYSIGRTTYQKLSDNKRHETFPRDDDGAIEFQITEDTIRVMISEFCILANSIMDRVLGKRRRRKENNSVLYRFYWRRNFFTFELTNVIQENIQLISLFQDHVAYFINIQSIIASGLIAGGNMPADNDKRYSLQSWILLQCIVTSRKNSTWLSPDLLLASKRGRHTKTQCIESISGLSKESDWRFLSKQGQTQLFSTTLSHHSVLKEWCPQRHKTSFSMKCISRHVQCQRLLSKIIDKRIGMWGHMWHCQPFFFL